MMHGASLMTHCATIMLAILYRGRLRIQEISDRVCSCVFFLLEPGNAERVEVVGKDPALQIVLVLGEGGHGHGALAGVVPDQGAGVGGHGGEEEEGEEGVHEHGEVRWQTACTADPAPSRCQVWGGGGELNFRAIFFFWKKLDG